MLCVCIALSCCGAFCNLSSPLTACREKAHPVHPSLHTLTHHHMCQVHATFCIILMYTRAHTYIHIYTHINVPLFVGICGLPFDCCKCGPLLPVGMATCSVMGCVVALKEIRLNSEEGTPFTAIREGEHLLEQAQDYSHV